MITEEMIENWFSYHSPNISQQASYIVIREQAKIMAHTINNHCPDSADKSAAIRLLRECVMIANASIACGGK